jgi:hypothetical protein
MNGMKAHLTPGFSPTSPFSTPLERSIDAVRRISLTGCIKALTRERVENAQSKAGGMVAAAATNPTPGSSLARDIERYADAVAGIKAPGVRELEDAAKNELLPPSVRSAARDEMVKRGLGPEGEARKANELMQQMEATMRRVNRQMFAALQSGDANRVNDAILDASRVAQISDSLRGNLGGRGDMIANYADAKRDQMVANAERVMNAQSVDAQQQPASSYQASMGMR